MDPLRLDTRVSDRNVGSIFRPWDESPVGNANARVARIYSVERALITTNGTTASNSLVIHGLLSEGDQVIVERDCHGSVLNSLNMVRAHPVWIKPEYDQCLGVNLAATVAGVRKAMERGPNAKVAVLTSPNYHGIVGDLEQVIAELHRNGLIVVVDSAHGANYLFHEDLPTSAVEAGADFVTMSVHKSTEAPSQGSVVLLNTSDPVLLDAINSTTAISTSFNTGILALTEEAIFNLELYGKDRISTALKLSEDFRRQTQAMEPMYKTWGAETAGRPGFAQLDSTRVTVDVSGTGLTGIEVEQLMQVERPGLLHVVAELGELRNVLFLVSWGNDWRDVDIAMASLQQIAIGHKRPPPPPPPTGLPHPPGRLATPGNAAVGGTAGSVNAGGMLGHWGCRRPASADATRVITLSPVFARPGALPRSRRCWTSSGRPRRRARVAGRISPALATRRVSSKAIRMRSGWLRDSICWVLLFWDRFSVSKTIIPEAQEHLLATSGPRYTPSFGGFGFRKSKPRYH